MRRDSRTRDRGLIASTLPLPLRLSTVDSAPQALRGEPVGQPLLAYTKRTGLVPDFDQLVRFLPAVEPVVDGSDVGG
jgi:hypothetical protein